MIKIPKEDEKENPSIYRGTGIISPDDIRKHELHKL